MGIAVENNAAMKRFEVKEEGSVAFLEYKEKEKTIALVHTEVPPSIGGRGIAQALAAYAFAYAKEKGLKVIIYCSFVAVWVKRHPELEEEVEMTVKTDDR